jgi:cytochrome c oxidase subunit IV
MSEHIVEVSTYIKIFTALMVLTAVTVIVAFIDLGPLNNFVMLAIAVVKATLVVLFFMHVYYSSRLIWVVVVAGFFWLGIMFVLTGSDYLTRGFIKGVYEPTPTRAIRPDTHEHSPGESH